MNAQVDTKNANSDMATDSKDKNTRIIIIDDSQDIHEDFNKILLRKNDHAELDNMEAMLFGEEDNNTKSSPLENMNFQLDHALQGQEGFQMVQKSLEDKRPYALAFVDMRMPPGWDGLETIEHIWQVDPDIQIVICSAYSDHSWQEIAERLDYRDKLYILQKPFAEEEVLQIAHTLVEKKQREQESSQKLDLLGTEYKKQEHILEETNQALAAEKAHTQRIERDLIIYQKLKNIGQLATGIAHEISMLSQFTINNIKFLKKDFDQIDKLLSTYRDMYSTQADTQEYHRLVEQIRKQEKDIKLFDLETDVPDTCDQMMHAANNVLELATAMQEFDYSSQKSEGFSDINRMIQNMLRVSESDYKYIADIETELKEIPKLFCNIGDINQVLINLISNAIHAIATSDLSCDSEDKGNILISTEHVDGNIIIRIKDSGGGIPEELHSEVFKPFFTTKAPGKGSGQGLAIARAIVEDDHGGNLTFNSNSEHGTTFIVQLPIGERQPDTDDAF